MQEYVLSARRLTYPKRPPTPLRGVAPRRSAPRAQVQPRPDFHRMTALELLHACQIQTERFGRGLPCDSRYAYELFRRALVERNDLAWELIYQQYASMVERWVRNTSAFAHTDETSEFFVSAAFTRFWRAITPERFAAFPTVASLLHYLQRCAGCVVIDSVRARTWAVVLPEQQIELTPCQRPSADEEALARLDREEFWRCVQAQLRSDAERVVLINSFVFGMKPGDIYARHPELFENVTSVYVTKRNVLTRLGNNATLRQQLL